MLAAVFHGKKDLRIEDVKAPLISKPNEVLIEIKACGICGTDIKIFNGEIPVNPPLILGHECSGEVVEIGEDVKYVRPKDKVVIDPNIPCLTCYYCRNGMENLCKNVASLGYTVDGAFARYVVVPEIALYKIPKDMSFIDATLTEPLACVLSGFNKCQVKPGDTVVVLGMGPIGLLFLQLFKNSNAGRVIVSEVIEERCTLANKFGADYVINPQKEDVIKRVKDLTSGRGADVVVEAIGHPAATKQAIQIARPGGRIILFGINPENAEVSFQPRYVTINELQIVGNYIDYYTFIPAINLLHARKIDAKMLISHTFPLKDILEAFKVSISGKAIKVVVYP